MGSKSKKGGKRQVDFSSGIKILSEMMDEKFLQNSQHFTKGLSTMKVRLEALEDLLMEKFGETEASLQERIFTRIEKMQGFQAVETPVQKGSVIRIKVKEEVIGSESPTNPMTDAFMAVGHNQINAALDTLLVGAIVGETRDVTLPDPNNVAIQRKLTATIIRIFKGDEVANEPKPETAPVENTGS